MREPRYWEKLPEGRQWGDIAQFCVCCFADSVWGGSWGGDVFQGGCMNCGAGGSSITLSLMDIKQIRQQASWVGKRYYPHEEDFEKSKNYPTAYFTTELKPGQRLSDPDWINSEAERLEGDEGVVIKIYRQQDIREARERANG